VDRQRDDLVSVSSQSAQCAQHVAHRRADVLAPVHRRQDELLIGRQRRHAGIDRPVVAADLGARVDERVDNGIADNVDVARRYAFTQQVGARLPRRRKVQAGGLADEAAVELLGERRLQIAGAQARLDVGNGNAAHEAGSSRSRRCSGVALHDDTVIRLSPQDLRDLLGHATELSCKPLLLDDISAVVGDRNAEEIE
jgi:hypothetical protein